MNIKNENQDNLEGLGDMLPAEVLKTLNELLERMHQEDYINHGSKIEFVYVAPGAQHVETQINIGAPSNSETLPNSTCLRRKNTIDDKAISDNPTEGIRHSISKLMQEQYGDEPLFNQQSHWQAIYRILVDKEYCRDSDFEGFDAFIRTVMPEDVNKPYSKGSLKQISQTDFVRPFKEWKYDALTSKTRKPYDRMVAVARRFQEILEENGL